MTLEGGLNKCLNKMGHSGKILCMKLVTQTRDKNTIRHIHDDTTNA